MNARRTASPGYNVASDPTAIAVFANTPLPAPGRRLSAMKQRSSGIDARRVAYKLLEAHSPTLSSNRGSALADRSLPASRQRAAHSLSSCDLRCVREQASSELARIKIMPLRPHVSPKPLFTGKGNVGTNPDLTLTGDYKMSLSHFYLICHYHVSILAEQLSIASCGFLPIRWCLPVRWCREPHSNTTCCPEKEESYCRRLLHFWPKKH